MTEAWSPCETVPASLVAQCCGWLAGHTHQFDSLAGLPTDLRETVLRCLAQRELLDDRTFGLLFSPQAGFGRLRLAGNGVSDAGLCRFLDECHDSLAELTITSCPRISGLSLQRVGQLCTGLRSLHISDPGPLVDEPAIASLFPSSSSRDKGGHTGHGGTLRSLVLDACGERLQDASLVRMAQLWSGLVALRLSECPDLSDAFVYASAPILSGSLTSLELSGCSYLSDLSLRALTKHLTNLETLKLNQNPSITHKGLAHIATSSVGASLTWLEMNANSLSAIPPEIGHMTALIHLSAGSNNIASLPPEIGNLKNLTSLMLFYTQLQTLPNEFCALFSLKTLHLGANEITRLPDAFGDLTSLEALCLNDNQLEALPSSIGKLHQLRVFSLATSVRDEFPPGFWTLTQLQTLDLATAHIDHLPDEIGQLRGLTSLDLEPNDLQSLPDSLCCLTDLKRLALAHNLLTELPSEIGKLSNLTFLSVDNNRLLSLPASVANLHKLKALCLAANDGLGPSLANLGLPSCADQPQQQPPPPTQQRQLFPELCVLSLERTGLASLPPFVCQVASLTALSLGFNSLTSLPADFAQLQRLKTLDLGSNLFAGVLPTAVLGLAQLIELSVDHNALSELPDELGSRLSRLRSVNLSGNHFGEVPRQIMDMPALERVDLSANFIVGIDDDARQALLRMPRLRELDVSENPVAEQPLPAALQDLLTTTRQDQDQ